MNNKKKLECRNCSSSSLKLQTPPDGVITFICEECGNTVSWKISHLSNRIDARCIPHESTGIEFTRIEKSIAKMTIITIILLSALLLLYVFMKK